MKKISFSFISDTIFLFLIGMFFSLPIFSGIVKKPFNVICSILFGLITSILFFKLTSNKRTKLLKTEKDKKEFSNALTQLNFMSKTELFNFFREYLQKKKLYFIETRLGFIVPEKGFYLFFKFNYDPIEKVDIVRFYNALTENQTAVILATEFSEDIIAFSKRFNGKILLSDFYELFLDLKKYNHLPPAKYYLLEENTRYKIRLSDIFYKKNAKNYLLFGIAFSLLSFFVPLKIYYVICSAFFLILSLVSLLYGKENKTTKTKI